MSELLDQVKKLKQQLEERAYETDKADARSFTKRAQGDIGTLHKFLFQLGMAGHWIYLNIISPVGRWSSHPLRWLFRQYRRVWEKVVYYDDQFGNRLFSKTRAGMFLTISIVFAWFVFIPAVAFLYDLGLYLATVKADEIVYLTNSQEILPEENIHSVQGCHALPCTDKNSIYFRIRATYFNEAWSLAHGRGLFFPDYVAASVPLSISRCTITSYGVRVKLIMRGMDIYPDLLRTECAPLQGDLPDGVAP